MDKRGFIWQDVPHTAGPKLHRQVMSIKAAKQVPEQWGAFLQDQRRRDRMGRMDVHMGGDDLRSVDPPAWL